MKKIFILITIILVSCSDKKKSKKHEVEQESESNKNQIIQKFVEDNNVKIDWDTLDLKYSVQYETIKNDNQIISDASIIDISKKDSTYFVKVECNGSPFYYFNLQTFNKLIVEYLLNLESKEYSQNNFILLVKIEQLNKGIIEPSSYGDEFESFVEFYMSDDFYGNGNLLNIKVID